MSFGNHPSFFVLVIFCHILIDHVRLHFYLCDLASKATKFWHLLLTGTDLQRMGQVGNARPGQLSDRHLRSAFSHHLGQLPRPVRLLWSIVCATLQGTRKQGRLGSADLENCLLGVHLSRSYLVKFVSLLLAYHPLGPTTFWVRPPVLSICVVSMRTCLLCFQVLSPFSRKRPKRCLSLHRPPGTVMGLCVIQCCEDSCLCLEKPIQYCKVK